MHAESIVKDNENARGEEHLSEHTECSECERLRAECDRLEAECDYLKIEMRLQHDFHMSERRERLFLQDYDGSFRINEAAFKVMDAHKRAIVHNILVNYTPPSQEE